MSIDQNVSHPSHYGGKDDPYETIKVIDAWGLDKSFCLGNVIKYISRAGKKDGNSLLQDLMKAQFYLNYEVEKQRREVDDCECKDNNDCDNSVEHDVFFACSHRDDCGVHTISVPDDVGDAINKVADYFLDSEDDYEIGITDDGALVIASSDYDWDNMEADYEKCD